MLFVWLVLLPDGRVGDDDEAGTVGFEVGKERLSDVVAGALVERAAEGGGAEQCGIVEAIKVLAENPEGKTPIVELDVGSSFHGEEGLFFAVAEVADDGDLVVGVVGEGAHFASGLGVEGRKQTRARFGLMAHSRKGN